MAEEKKTNLASALANSIKKAVSVATTAASAISAAKGNSGSGSTKASFSIGSSGGSGGGSSGTETTRNGETVYTGQPSNGSRNSLFPVANKKENTKGTSTDYGTYQADLQRLTQAQRQAQIDELKAARTKALANLDAQEQTIKPTYQNARNLTSANSQQGARSFAEYLANRGLTNSGASAQGEINRLSTLQNNLGNINTQEANAYRDIANQRTAIENNYIAGLANANNALTTNYYNNLLDYNNKQRDYIQQLQNQANYQYYDDIQARINELLAQGYSPNSQEILQLQALRGTKSYDQYNSGMANAQNNILAGNINYNNAAQLGMTVPQAQAYRDNVIAQQEAEAQRQAEQTEYERQQAAEKIQRDLLQQEFKNTMDYNNYLLNAQKVANDTAMTNYNTNKPYNTTVTHISSNNKGGNNNGLSAKNIKSAISKLPSSVQNTVVDFLYNNYLIDTDTFAELIK